MSEKGVGLNCLQEKIELHDVGSSRALAATTSGTTTRVVRWYARYSQQLLEVTQLVNLLSLRSASRPQRLPRKIVNCEWFSVLTSKSQWSGISRVYVSFNRKNKFNMQGVDQERRPQMIENIGLSIFFKEIDTLVSHTGHQHYDRREGEYLELSFRV